MHAVTIKFNKQSARYYEVYKYKTITDLVFAEMHKNHSYWDP